MSDSQDDAEQKKKQQKPEQAPSNTEQPASATPQVQRPIIGTPVSRPRIGTPIGTPAPAAAPTSQPPQQTSSPPPAAPASTTQRPVVGTPVGAAKGPTVGTPIGTPKPAAAGQQAPQAGTPATGTAPRPTVGTPRPSIGSPVGTPAAAAAPRPAVSAPATAGRPTTPAKRVETKEEISRRNFLRGLAVLGGIVAVAQFGGLGPYLQGSVGESKGTPSSQNILDAVTGNPITTSSLSDANPWLTFVYPRTGNSNVDNDTFRQCVIIRLPAGFTAPSSVSVKDSTGATYVGFSRVCVHLWCLWSYVPSDKRMECPCHGSQYVPGSGTYPLLPSADNQPPGQAVAGPAALQTAPNNALPLITLKLNSDGSFAATGTVGQIGCGQKC